MFLLAMTQFSLAADFVSGTVTFDPAGTNPTCDVMGSLSAESPGSLIIKTRSGAAPTGFSVVYGNVAHDLTGAALTDVPPGAAITIRAKGSETLICTATLSVATSPSSGGTDAKGDSETTIDSLVEGAKKFADTQDLKKLQGDAKAVIVHLPDGKPLKQLPEYIREGEAVKIVAIIPTDATAELTVTSCGTIKKSRVFGSSSDAAEKAGTKQSAVTYRLLTLKEEVRCADGLTYTVSVQNPELGSDSKAEAETTIIVHNLYRFSWGVGYGFDTGKTTTVAAGTRIAEDGVTEESVVDVSDAATGMRALVTLNLHLVPVDMDDHRPTDFVPALTLGLDPANLTKGFVGGASIFPYPGFGVTLGASVFQDSRLDPNSGLTAGGPLPASGTIPTTSGWETPSIGFYAGATITGNLIADLLGGS